MRGHPRDDEMPILIQRALFISFPLMYHLSQISFIKLVKKADIEKQSVCGAVFTGPICMRVEKYLFPLESTFYVR